MTSEEPWRDHDELKTMFPLIAPSTIPNLRAFSAVVNLLPGTLFIQSPVELLSLSSSSISVASAAVGPGTPDSVRRAGSMGVGKILALRLGRVTFLRPGARMADPVASATVGPGTPDSGSVRRAGPVGIGEILVLRLGKVKLPRPGARMAVSGTSATAGSGTPDSGSVRRPRSVGIGTSLASGLGNVNLPRSVVGLPARMATPEKFWGLLACVKD